MTAPVDVDFDLGEAIAAAAAAASPLWEEYLLPADERFPDPVFSTLARPDHRLGLETIYEGYLVHYGRPRLFSPPDDDGSLLLGDYLYAHGLVRVAELGDVAAVGDLAELISLCAQARADDRDGDGAVWAATAALLGHGALGDARDTLRVDGDPGPLERAARDAAGDRAVEAAVAAHARLVG